jgi:hypothetical protein
MKMYSFRGMSAKNKPIHGKILASCRGSAWKKLLNKNIYPSHVSSKLVKKYKKHLKRW